ncbi:uncharacterized protein H6S33_001098 [Morchella sextelata]|uniref:uncharacterized protein n=1 Tax=Morchella sextelata TaxID=1174677 RepID=UPI001D05A73D|nr:uncharacterized protein H6S33_001098 [Morchella sextelata]KAH0608870.1 hypothetical protein H6S33_001098 [Morchella sextelata]
MFDPTVPPTNLTLEALPTAISTLELNTAHLENALFTQHEALTAIDETAATTAALKERAIVVLRTLESAEARTQELCMRLVEIGLKLDELPDDAEEVMRRRFVVVDRSLVAADEMTGGLMDWADRVYLDAYERERGQGGGEWMVPVEEEEEEEEDEDEEETEEEEEEEVVTSDEEF